MTSEYTLIHHAGEWRRHRDIVAVLRDDMATTADTLHRLGSRVELGDDAAGRSACVTLAALANDAATRLGAGATELTRYCAHVARGSERIVSTDDGGAEAETASVAPVAVNGGETQQSSVGEPPPAVVAELAPGRWPAVDVDGVRFVAERVRTDAARLTGLAAQVVDARPAESRGRAFDAMDARIGALCGPYDGVVAGSVQSLVVVASALDGYADVAASTRDEMRTIVARVDVDRARAAVLAAVGGEPTLVEPAAAGHLALAAAADDYRARVDDVGRKHADQMGPGSSVGNLSGVAGGVGNVPTGGGGGGAVMAVRRRASQPAKPAVDVGVIHRRAHILASQLPRHLGVRMAVGLARGHGDCGTLILVATSDDHDYLRPGVTLLANEWFVGRGSDPESALAGLAGQLGVELLAVVATDQAGVSPAS